ncbi:MAG TPA: hypothetical protein DCX25_02505 [Candidatus Pacebacteria bacterium]|nr:MAG: hypothetical protein UX00_C0004G0076 [Microgenomates group bacterium GW2011_GWB1_45_17]KKU23926.1 MAG: hypothetical protein UX35_C0003G0062 [Microgenomates group bacterium GW2011_GWA1_46_15]KKU24681.1 MAG: hypothetical protein UX36_C0001G0298 [Microgenomates group bacterium GW2011_GWC1_46_15]HAV15175.1 hypothetical protein [Candidatus Paceibacterota bacterium]HCR11114.1 hypothetical protein [Candidatus Paceibacterota bacterium]
MKSAQSIAQPTHQPSQHKLEELKDKLNIYEEKLAWKMKFYRGVIHESASSELKHAEVMVLRAMVDGLKQEVAELEQKIHDTNA